MGVVTRADSKFFWLTLERAGARPIREATRIVAKGLHKEQLAENRRLAQQVYHARMADLARQRVGLPIERDRATFRYHAAWYLKHVTPTKRGAAKERSMIRALLKHFSGWLLERIDVAAAREYLTKRTSKDKVAPATANRELDVLKAMLSAAVPKYLAANPLAGMKRLPMRRAAPPVLSHDDEARLLAVLEPPDRALIIAALDTLVRLSDLVKLKWAQDHGDHWEIHDPKAAPYRVPVSTRLRQALDALPRTGPRVFAHHASPNSVIYMFRYACADAGIRVGRPDGLTFHGLRHTGATRALAAGASVRDVMALGGWRDMKSMLRYLRPTAVDRALVDRMSRARPIAPIARSAGERAIERPHHAVARHDERRAGALARTVDVKHEHVAASHRQRGRQDPVQGAVGRRRKHVVGGDAEVVGAHGEPSIAPRRRARSVHAAAARRRNA